jgi:hypothetical protein
MKLTQYVLKKSWSLALVTVILLCIIALTSELLPEVEAKIIVIPALLLAIVTSFLELLKDSNVIN